MSELTPQSGPIAVYGATGYTGRLVARELARRGADFILAGRNVHKLEIVAEDVGGAETRAVELDDASGLRALFEPCAAVISCAGPFVLYGEPVLSAAVESSTHYVDTTGEQTYMREVFEGYGARASKQGVTAVTAMGFDYAPGDMIAALTAADMGPLDEIVLAYCTRGFGASRGTTRTALGMMSAEVVEWRDGELQAAPRSVGQGVWEFPEPVGEQRMVRYPSGEHITVPRHVETRNVRALLSASTVMPHPRLAPAAPVLMPAAQLMTRTPMRRLLEAGVSRLPDGPAEDDRRASQFTIVCEATGMDGRRRGIVHGRDPYGFTARATVHAALLCADPAYDRSGSLAPAEAFDSQAFMRAMSAAGLSYEVTPA